MIRAVKTGRSGFEIQDCGAGAEIRAVPFAAAAEVRRGDGGRAVYGAGENHAGG
ncbi:hypothetical protein SDC9_193295 [bioreactor metagenome]|uniref:Uncharacterized protein n=1 Tax=bioreactor metagenome TaxID=1076179 RepID=A0A645I361_9ZZZZ